MWTIEGEKRWRERKAEEQRASDGGCDLGRVLRSVNKPSSTSHLKTSPALGSPGRSPSLMRQIICKAGAEEGQDQTAINKALLSLCPEVQAAVAAR